MNAFTESEVEEAVLYWLQGLGWTVAHGPDIGPHTAASERTDYGTVVLGASAARRPERLNPALPPKPWTTHSAS